MLTTTLSPKVSSDDKIKTLGNEYGIPVTNEISERVNSMCNISAGFFKDGVIEGFFKGKDEGIAEGRVKGKAEGIAEGRVKGIAEGRVKGKAERDVEIIKTMLRKNRTAQGISELTDIPIEEVKKVQKSLTP